MASPTFNQGNEPVILGTAEAYPKNSYTQEEFMEAFLKVRLTWLACLSRSQPLHSVPAALCSIAGLLQPC